MRAKAALEARQREERAAVFEAIGSRHDDRADAIAEQSARHGAERLDLERRFMGNHDGRGT